MPPDIRDTALGRLGRIVVTLTAAFVGGGLVLRPHHLILLLNGLALSVSAGVATAYLPVAGDALRQTTPSRGDVLGAGIFFAGLSDVALRLESIAARDLGHPEILNSDIAAISIFLGVMSLVAFLWAPHAEYGHIPRDKWRFAGLIVAAGVAIAFAAALVQRTMMPTPLVRLE